MVRSIAFRWPRGPGRRLCWRKWVPTVAAEPLVRGNGLAARGAEVIQTLAALLAKASVVTMLRPALRAPHQRWEAGRGRGAAIWLCRRRMISSKTSVHERYSWHRAESSPRTRLTRCECQPRLRRPIGIPGIPLLSEEVL